MPNSRCPPRFPSWSGVGEGEGSVERPAFDIPGVGRIAIVRDRAGSAVGWITPEAQADEASPDD